MTYVFKPPSRMRTYEFSYVLTVSFSSFRFLQKLFSHPSQILHKQSWVSTTSDFLVESPPTQPYGKTCLLPLFLFSSNHPHLRQNLQSQSTSLHSSVFGFHILFVWIFLPHMIHLFQTTTDNQSTSKNHETCLDASSPCEIL